MKVLSFQSIFKLGLSLGLALSPLLLTGCETGSAADNRAASQRQQEMLRQMRADKRKMMSEQLEAEDTRQIEWSAPLTGE